MEQDGKKVVCRMATTAKIPVAPGLLSEVKLDYQRRFKQLKTWHNIPEALILNFDQTPLPYIFQCIFVVPIIHWISEVPREYQ